MKIPFRRILILASPFILILALIHSCYPLFPDKNRPRLVDSISYLSPKWFSNDRIIYIKWKERFGYVYGIIANLSVSGIRPQGAQYQICTSDLEGKNERVIRNFILKHRGGNDWQDEFFGTEGGVVPYYLDYNQKENLIVFSASSNSDLILLTADNKKIWRLKVDGYNPRLSPDGKKILYNRKSKIKDPTTGIVTESVDYSVWITNTDGSDNKIVFDFSAEAIWHPDGDKIIFYQNNFLKALNLINGIQEILFETNRFPESISKDASKIISGSVLYNFKTGQNEKIDNIPNNAIISPDGSKILGYPIDLPNIKVGLFDIKEQRSRKILIDHAVTLK